MSWLTGSSEVFALEVCRKDGSVPPPSEEDSAELSMSRNRYANKARNEARMNGQTLRGKPKRDLNRQITRLIMAGRDELDVNSTPADWLRSDARFSERVANGEVQTIASHGLPQSTLDKFKRLRDEIKQSVIAMQSF